MYIDEVKVVKIGEAKEISIANNPSLTITRISEDLTPNSAYMAEPTSSGDFNKGDTVIISAVANSSFSKSVKKVEFYCNDQPLDLIGESKGSLYTVRLNSVQPGEYTVRAVVTFTDDTTANTNTKTFTISDKTSFDDISVSTSGMLKTGQKFSISRRIKNNLDNDKTGVAILAVYDKNNKLLAIKEGTEFIIAAGEIRDFTVSIDALPEIPEGAYAKVFIWDDVKNAIPYISTFEVK